MNIEVWTTKDGRRIAITEMSDEHLRNTIAMLERKGFVNTEAALSPFGYFDADSMAAYYAEQEFNRLKWSPLFDALEEELYRRGLTKKETTE